MRDHGDGQHLRRCVVQDVSLPIKFQHAKRGADEAAVEPAPLRVATGVAVVAFDCCQEAQPDGYHAGRNV